MDADVHLGLGVVLAGRGEADEAIAHFEQALKIDPGSAEAHYALGDILAHRRRFDEAVAHFEQALKTKADFAEAHVGLAAVLLGRGRVSEAAEHFQQALQAKPDCIPALNNLAWIRATHPDAAFRDGRQALALAQRAVALSSGDAGAVDTLAAAYAESGRYGEAAETAHKAMDLARRQHKPALVRSMEAKIQLYEAGKPYRQPPVTPTKPPAR